MITPRTYGLIAAGILAAEGGFELIRLIASGESLQGYAMGTTLVLSITFIATTLATAILLAVRSSWGFTIAPLAVVGSLGFGASILFGGLHFGAIYVAAGFAAFACLPKSLPAYRFVPPDVRAPAA